MVEVIFKLRLKNKKYVEKTIKEALRSFNIEKKIRTVIIKRSKKLCKDDTEVDYSRINIGKVSILLGKKTKITKKLIFHELGHVWDAIEHGLNFSNIKLTKKQQALGGIIINLSLDGRLEKMKLPHYSKKERYKFFSYGNKKFKLGLTKRDFLKMWGAKLKKKGLICKLKQYGEK